MSTTPPTASRRRRLFVALAAVVLVGAAAGGAAVAVGASTTEQVGASADTADAAASAEPPTPPATVTPAPVAVDPAGSPVAPPLSEVAGLDSASTTVIAQLEYVHANWQATTSEQFGFVPGNNCVSFTSQSLLARGWTVDDEWYFDESGDQWSHSRAWLSSTAFRDYLAGRPDRATALTDDQRDQVKPGDVVQFDWDRSGDRDHTGIVTSVTRGADGSVDIRYAGHTDHTWDRSVDWAITVNHPGADVFYWSISG